MGDDTHADFGLAGTGQEGTTPRNDNQGPTTAAAAVVVAPPPPAADDDAMEPPLSLEPPQWRFINKAKKLTLHRRSLLLLRSATTMWSPASGCRSLPPPLIILPPPRRVWVTTATTMMKRTSRCRERGRTPMGEDDDDPMTAWHRIGGSRRHPTPTPMVVGQHHRTSDKRGRGGGGFHIQRSTRNR